VLHIFTIKPFSGHSMDIQQWVVKKSSDADYKLSACKFVVKKFWAQCHDWCVQKWSCLLLSWDAFRKFSPDDVYEESFGRIFTIYVCKNKGVSYEVQTHFGSFCLMRFMKKVLGTLSRFFRPKTELFAVNSDAFWKFSSCNVHKKISGRIFTIYVSENEAVCSEVHTHFGSSLPASFAEKVLGAYSWLMRPKTKLFAVKFRRILKVLRIQGLQHAFWVHFCVQKRSSLPWNSDGFWKFSPCKLHKKVWAHFLDFCVQKRSCLLLSWDAFWKFSLCEVYNKSYGRIITIFASTNEAVCCWVQTYFGNFPLWRL